MFLATAIHAKQVNIAPKISLQYDIKIWQNV